MAGKAQPVLFALRIDAAAEPGNAFPLGARRPLLLVARAPTLDAAIEMARETLSYHHWGDATLLGHGQVDKFGDDIADPKLRTVVDHASEHGSGILVYDL